MFGLSKVNRDSSNAILWADSGLLIDPFQVTPFSYSFYYNGNSSQNKSQAKMNNMKSIQSSRIIQADSKQGKEAVGFMDLPNDLTMTFGNVPIPVIPQALLGSLSSAMFEPKTQAVVEGRCVGVSKSKKNNTHGKKGHRCLMCDKKFSRPCALKTHMYTHTGEKPYCCPYGGCSNVFSVRSNLKRHMSAMHDGGIIPFQ